MSFSRCSKLNYIKLKSGGYQTTSLWRCDTDIKGYQLAVAHQIILEKNGVLTVLEGYCWDGASGPVIDRKTNMYAGLAHDALYELLRKGLLPWKERQAADSLYRDLYVENGGYRVISWFDYAALRLFAGYAAKRQPEAEDRKRSV